MTLQSLMSGRLFRIPEYQRAYSWGPKQREDLFADIVKLRGTTKGHFMATMVGLRRGTRRISADDYTVLEIVDGQQRLTTLTILLRALQKRLAKGDPAEVGLAAEVHTLLVKGDDLNLLLLQTNHDSSHIFVDYVREGHIADSTSAMTSADQNLISAIQECDEFVDSWLATAGCIDLLAIMRNQLSVIFHEIDDEGLVYTVFEVLNSRGLDVTWFDKVKAMLMAIVFEHGDEGGKKGTIEELHSIWKDIYRTIGKRQTLNKETLRFAATLKATIKPNRPLSEEASTDQLITLCGDKPKKAVEISKWLLKVSEAESRLLSNQRLRAVSQIVQARLAAVAIMLRGFDSADEKHLLQVWENATFRIYGMADKDARTSVGAYVSLSWKILNEGLSPKDTAAALKKIADDLVSLEDAIDGLRASNVYHGRTEMLRYFFYRYDEYLAKKAGQKLNESQWNKVWEDEPARSIEHIKPQSSNANCIHQLGNLTVLPPGVNSTLQDKPPKEKAKTYRTSGLLGATEVADFVAATSWSSASVNARTEGLLDWASKAWKF